MRTNPLHFAMLGLTLLLAASGCATRGYVRRQMTDLRTDMDSADLALRSDLQSVRSSAASADTTASAANRSVRSVRDLALGRVAYREITRYQIHFAFNSAEPQTGSGATLEQAADQITRNPQALIELYGFADPTGSAAYNLELGRRRAEAVLRALTECVPGQLGRFQLVSYGADPPAQEASRLGAGAERRQVEVVLVEKTEPEKTNEAISDAVPRP